MIPQRAQSANEYEQLVAAWTTGDVSWRPGGSCVVLTAAEVEEVTRNLDAADPVGATNAPAKSTKSKRQTSCGSLVKTRRKHDRKSLTRDDRSLTRIEGLKGVRTIGAGGGLSVAPPSRTAVEKSIKAAKDNRDLPRWQDADDLLRAAMFNEALGSFGEPRAFSLNLTQSVIDKALAGHQGFASNMLDIIRNEMRKAGLRGVEIWLVPEFTNEGRLHVHGGFACGDNDLEAVNAALIRAGGNWKGRGDAKPLVEKPQYDEAGWARYVLKHVGGARKRLKGSAVARTSRLNDAAPRRLALWRQLDHARRCA